MSWQNYVDDEICSKIPCKAVAIAGHDGRIWAKFEKDPAFQITQAELKLICDQMNSSPETFHGSGIHVGGQRYICLTSESNLLRGRKGGTPLCIVKTLQAVIVAAAEDGSIAGQLNIVVEKLGEYLTNSGY
ncbi:profilin-like [Limulus polyphemus]|uniref:Profilin n=1 Tax=Limulus polyphemus TaxID=6850 RepID=A0ABM1BVI2_LIMPO|nr:profilin-like [Limulus polyphemus]